MKKTIFFALIAALGTFLYGYHTGIITGTLLFITPDFHLSIFQQEVVVSSLLFSGCVGAISGGGLADYLGRKKTLFVSAIFLFLGTLILTEACGFSMLVLGRLFSGFAIGIISILVPLYIAEISPPNIRGALVTIAQFMTAVGILASYIVTFSFSVHRDWRDMFSFGLLPLALFFFGLFLIPESPLWLKDKSKKKEKTVFPKYLRRTVWIGLSLSVFQQVTGINTVIYYAPRILEEAGFLTSESTIFNTMLIGIVNVAFSAVALATIDWLGRRTLLIGGLAGMAISLAALSCSLYYSLSNLALFSIFFYIASFAVSLGPVMGLILSEIFPQAIRGRAMGLAFFMNWFSNSIVSLTFLTFVHEIGIIPTFSFFTVLCLIALWFAWKMIPETKGKTFAEVQKSLSKHSLI